MINFALGTFFGGMLITFGHVLSNYMSGRMAAIIVLVVAVIAIIIISIVGRWKNDRN